MKAGLIAELINAYNVYKDGKRIGVDADVELPELEALTETSSAAGVLGEIDIPATGHFGSLKTKIKFAILSDDYFSMLDTTKPLELTLRASGEYTDKETGNLEDISVKIIVRGWVTNSNLGSLEQGKKGEPELEIETTYLKVDIDGATRLELDKLNFKYVVNGKDLLAKIRKNI